MHRNIKLIWDFRGPDAGKIAEHFQVHLREALDLHPQLQLGWSQVNAGHSIAFLIVPESLMIEMRDRFKPHRGEYISA